jgi:hypothetical protein
MAVYGCPKCGETEHLRVLESVPFEKDGRFDSDGDWEDVEGDLGEAWWELAETTHYTCGACAAEFQAPALVREDDEDEEEEEDATDDA